MMWAIVTVVFGARFALADGASAPWGRYTFTAGWTLMDDLSSCHSKPPGDVRVRVTEERAVRVTGVPGRLVRIKDDSSAGITAVFRTKPVDGTYRNTMIGVWAKPDGVAHAVVTIGRFGPEGNELCTDGWTAVGRFVRE